MSFRKLLPSSARVLSSLSAYAKKPMSTRSFHQSSAPRSSLPFIGSLVTGTGSALAHYSSSYIVTTEQEIDAIARAAVVGTTVGLLTYGLLTPFGKVEDSIHFYEIFSRVLTDLSYSSNEIEALITIFTFYQITPKSFKNDNPSIKPKNWDEDTIRMWMIDTISALKKTESNTTQDRLKNIDATQLAESFAILFPQEKGQVFNYKKSIVQLADDLCERNRTYLEKHNGISPSL